MARRKQDWNQWCSDLKHTVRPHVSLHALVTDASCYTTQANNGQVKNGFNCVIIAAGNNVNSDGALAMVHITEDATGVSTTTSPVPDLVLILSSPVQFLETRFRTDKDTTLGHMKAQL